MSKEDKKVTLTDEEKVNVKKAYVQGFMAQVLVSDKSEEEAKGIYKDASERGEKIQKKHEKIRSTILESQKS